VVVSFLLVLRPPFFQPMLREREREPERQKHISQTFADLTENFIDSGIYLEKAEKDRVFFAREQKR